MTKAADWGRGALSLEEDEDSGSSSCLDCLDFFPNKRSDGREKHIVCSTNQALPSKPDVFSGAFGDLRIGPLSIAGVSPTQKYGIGPLFVASAKLEHQRQLLPTTSGSNLGRDSFEDRIEKNYPIHPSHHEKSPQRYPNDRLRPRPRPSPSRFRQQRYQWDHDYYCVDQLKEPPSYSVAANNSSIVNSSSNYYPEMEFPPKRARALPTMPKRFSQQPEQPQNQDRYYNHYQNQNHNHNQNHHTRDLKRGSPDLKHPSPQPQPALLPIPPSLPREKNLIPRVINVSRKKSYASNTNPSPGGHSILSPISFSSPMLRKKVPISQYYPSRDVIEEQISKSGHHDSQLPQNVILPSLSTRDTTATATATAIPTETNQTQTQFAAISPAPAHAPPIIMNPPKRLESRPTKPLRVDSLSSSNNNNNNNRGNRGAINISSSSSSSSRSLRNTNRQDHSNSNILSTRFLRKTTTTTTSSSSKTYRKYDLQAFLSTLSSQKHRLQQQQLQQDLVVNSDGNVNGNVNGNANGNANGKANGSGNENANANGNENANANENENENANANANGNGNGNGNGEVRGTTCVPTPRHNATAIATATVTATRHKGSRPIPSKQPHAVSSFSTSIKVEVYTGVFHVLRGGKEIALAKEQNFLVPFMCVICNEGYSCIADAAFAICPLCNVVQPTTDSVSGACSTPNNGNDRWGVCTGFTPPK
eukprot:jgi/Psemu1/7283/gm1.7283_g